MTTGVLLAAGAGTRFGSDKLLHQLADGTPIAVASARHLRAACDQVVAVIRPGNTELAKLLAEQGCQIVECPDAASGMGHTLAAGVAASRHADGWLVALADMPFIAAESYRSVLAVLQGGALLAAPSYQGRRGHPVAFARCWLEELLALAGDQGARSILTGHHEHIVVCELDDPGVLADIDRPQDLPSELPAQ
ncbi:MAG: NTP transferase domain-containing protein [Massilia sp.]